MKAARAAASRHNAGDGDNAVKPAVKLAVNQRGTEPEPRSAYASAAEAMRLLNVRQQTLYAYVSRGLIRSIPQKGLKDRLYLRDDITRVGMRSAARAGHGPVAASAMNWGEPIFPTSITEITPQGPRYRGRLAADLVRGGVAFEAVAELLWTGE
ncbi:MAG: citrate synthase [Rhodoferax sp.]|nr:citrate synthase [Rhodoferax sp.]